LLQLIGFSGFQKMAWHDLTRMGHRKKHKECEKTLAVFRTVKTNPVIIMFTPTHLIRLAAGCAIAAVTFPEASAGSSFCGKLPRILEIPFPHQPSMAAPTREPKKKSTELV
jgi:hypothetical protein